MKTEESGFTPINMSAIKKRDVFLVLQSNTFVDYLFFLSVAVGTVSFN